MKKAKAEFHHKKDGPSGKTDFAYKNEKNPNLEDRWFRKRAYLGAILGYLILVPFLCCRISGYHNLFHDLRQVYVI